MSKSGAVQSIVRLWTSSIGQMLGCFGCAGQGQYWQGRRKEWTGGLINDDKDNNDNNIEDNKEDNNHENVRLYPCTLPWSLPFGY